MRLLQKTPNITASHHTGQAALRTAMRRAMVVTAEQAEFKIDAMG
jgi:hypothetical protein